MNKTVIFNRNKPQEDSAKIAQLIVLSAVGTDRTGVVNDITRVILDCGGNIEESRMTALGAEFAMLMLISGNWHTLTKLQTELDKLTRDSNLEITVRKTGQRTGRADCMPYGVDVVCLDQPGIVFSLASFFSARGIEIADLATRRYAAAHSGSPMFSMQMSINVPGTLSISHLRDEFLELCDQLNIDSILEPVKS
ncbi:MAG: ACT domain-containing protein [Woeseiaceae bacterium]|jgi:glycine cleavage system transcriptional repressor